MIISFIFHSPCLRMHTHTHTHTHRALLELGNTILFIYLFIYLFDDPEDVGNLISGSSAFTKTSLIMWKFTVHVLLKPGLENFEHYFTRL